MSEPIRALVTGGTFDKEYDELHGRLYFKDTHLAEMLRTARCRVDVRVRTLMMIDSLEMTEADRRIVVESCRSCDEQRIVVTHGTSALEETAYFLTLTVKTRLPVVLVGAQRPPNGLSSDTPPQPVELRTARCFTRGPGSRRPSAAER